MLELRPDLQVGLITLIVMLLATAGIIAAILAGDAPTVFAPIVSVLLGVPLLLALGALLRARIVLTPHELIVRGPLSRQHRPRPHVAEVVRASIYAPRGAPGESLFLLNAQRNLVIRVSGGGYKREDLDRLVDALGVPCTDLGASVDAAEFNKAYPNLVSWPERHPYRIPALILTCLAAAALITALIATTT